MAGEWRVKAMSVPCASRITKALGHVHESSRSWHHTTPRGPRAVPQLAGGLAQTALWAALSSGRLHCCLRATALGSRMAAQTSAAYLQIGLTASGAHGSRLSAMVSDRLRPRPQGRMSGADAARSRLRSAGERPLTGAQ